MGETYFNAINGEEVKKGNVKADVVVEKISGGFSFNFTLKGVVQIPCTRCLEEMDQEIFTKNRLIVKSGKKYEEVSEEIVIIPEAEGEINIAWYLYEFIALNIPISHHHAEGKCNKEAFAKLHKYSAVQSKEWEWENEQMEENEDTNDEDRSDSRWDILRSLNFDDE